MPKPEYPTTDPQNRIASSIRFLGASIVFGSGGLAISIGSIAPRGPSSDANTTGGLLLLVGGILLLYELFPGFPQWVRENWSADDHPDQS